MGKSHKLPRFRLSHGAYYWVPYIDGKQQWIRIGTTYSEAILRYAQLEAERTAPRKNIEALWKDFRAGERFQGLATSTRANYEIWAAKLIKAMGTVLPHQITYADGVQWLRVSPKKVTAQREMQLLGTLLNHARDIGWLEGANPLAGLRKGERSRRRRYITDAEWGAVLKECDPRTSVAVRFARLTSLRREDFLRLRWSDVKEGDGVYVQIQKTKQQAHIAWTPQLRGLLDEAKALRSEKVASVYVFCEPAGRPIRGDTLLDRWKQAGKRAGVHDITLHDIRRKRLTDLQKKPGGLATAQNVAVHSDPRTTQGYYADPLVYVHLPPETELEAASSPEGAEQA